MSGERLVKVTVPRDYGTAHVKYADGHEEAFQGGQQAEVPERVAGYWGVKPTGPAKTQESGQPSKGRGAQAKGQAKTQE